MGIEIVKASVEHALYRFFGEDGALLYIGIALQPFARMGQHRGDKSWWGEVTTVTIERHPDRPSVLAAERSAIRAEKPRYNVVHASEHKRRPRVAYSFTYWEPAIDGLLRVANTMPVEAVGLWLRCRNCDQGAVPREFFEQPHGEIECRAKCPHCGGFMSTEIPPTAHRLAFWKGAR